MALARRDLSGKPAHATSEVSTAACSRPHSSHAHTTLYRDGLWLLTGDVCKGTCCRRRLDDAVCSRDVEEVVAAGLQTCSAHVCMTHVRTAARSHTHRDQLSNASAAHFVREDEDPCKMTYSRMALIERDLSATTQMQMHSQMGFSCSNRRAARQRQASGAAHTRHGGARLARACVTETPQAESRATGGARLLAQTTAARVGLAAAEQRSHARKARGQVRAAVLRESGGDGE